MSTRELSRLELVEQCFNCCIQCVKSYGQPLDEKHRANLIRSMENFRSLARRDIKAEIE